MKSVTIIGSRPRKHPFPLFSWLIRLAEWSDISHVGWKFDEDDQVYDAHFNSINKTPHKEYLEKHKDVYNIQFYVKDSESQKLRKFFEDKVGPQKGYFCKVFGAFIPQMVRNITFQCVMLPNFGFWCERGWTCSEIIKDAIAECMDQLIPLLINRRIKNDNYTTDDIIILAKKIAE